MTKIKDSLIEVRPTVFVGVPRVWEKFEAALKTKFGAATGVKAGLAAWAQRTELSSFERGLAAGQPIDSVSRRLAHRLVLSKVHHALGLDQLRLASSGAAPISLATLNFFASLGIVIHEGYGMTETTGLISATPYMKPKFGSVGRTIHGVETKIADDGEILTRGQSMTRGYFKMPEESADLFDAQV